MKLINKNGDLKITSQRRLSDIALPLINKLSKSQEMFIFPTEDFVLELTVSDIQQLSTNLVLF